VGRVWKNAVGGGEPGGVKDSPAQDVVERSGSERQYQQHTCRRDDRVERRAAPSSNPDSLPLVTLTSRPTSPRSRACFM